jgi:hypothetical protein
MLPIPLVRKWTPNSLQTNSRWTHEETEELLGNYIQKLEKLKSIASAITIQKNKTTDKK